GHPVDEMRLIFWRGYFTMHGDTDGLDAVESYGFKGGPFIRPRWRDVFEATANAWFFSMCALGLIGLIGFVGRGRDPRLWSLVGAMAAPAAAPLAFFGDIRFHVPVLPLLAIVSAATAVTGFRAMRQLGRTEAPTDADADAADDIDAGEAVVLP